MQIKYFSFIAELERAAIVRKIAVYHFLISFLVPELSLVNDLMSTRGAL